MTIENISSTGCCEPFNPLPWEDKEITWNEKLFVKDHITCFLHIPINMGKKIIKNMKFIEEANKEEKPVFVFDDCASLWGSTMYIDVTRKIPGANMTTMSGTFLTKVFEGPYKDAGKWAKEMKNYAESRGKEIKSLLFGYTTCPNCAKEYGKNYVVLFAQVS
ncbi:hypothetical protein KKF55_05415 [Patescibacteria group bacterium]|nr:hypothetical protein [Patescibacteria group bacterium]